MLSYKYNCSKCGFGTDSMLSMSMHIGGCVLKRTPSTATHLIFAAIIIAFLFVMPSNANGQTDPGPAPECYWIDEQWVCISHIALTPFVPTSTPVPAPTVAPTVTPTPTIVIQPLYRLHLPLIYR
jgi:hypothetical protein